MKMQTAITTKQAREICKGRTPLIPVEYETAVKALTECVTLDEAKYWDNKADALAAWAKIYHSPEAERKAKQLKLHAYRRMGELAKELRPTTFAKGRRGPLPGAESMLMANGLNRSKARAATWLASRSPAEFSTYVERKRVLSPLSLPSGQYRGGVVDAVSAILRTAHCGIRKYDPIDAARQMVTAQRLGLTRTAHDLIDWLDAFEQALPRAKP